MERTIHLDGNKDLQILFGKYDQNLRLIEKELNLKISRQSNGLKIVGSKEEVNKACDLFDYLLGIVGNGAEVKARDIIYALKLAQPG